MMQQRGQFTTSQIRLRRITARDVKHLASNNGNGNGAQLTRGRFFRFVATLTSPSSRTGSNEAKSDVENLVIVGSGPAG